MSCMSRMSRLPQHTTMSEEAIPKGIEGQLARFQSALVKLEAVVVNHFSKPPKQLDASLTPVQRAQMHLAVAKGLHHTFLLHLRTQGLAARDHPMHKEAERLKFYGRKVRKLESATFLAKHQPSLDLDVAAANRFITHAIPDLRRDQKRALKQVTNNKTRKSAESAQAGDDPAELAQVFLEETFGQPAVLPSVEGEQLADTQANRKTKRDAPSCSRVQGNPAVLARAFLEQTLRQSAPSASKKSKI